MHFGSGSSRGHDWSNNLGSKVGHLADAGGLLLLQPCNVGLARNWIHRGFLRRCCHSYPSGRDRIGGRPSRLSNVVFGQSKPRPTRQAQVADTDRSEHWVVAHAVVAPDRRWPGPGRPIIAASKIGTRNYGWQGHWRRLRVSFHTLVVNLCNKADPSPNLYVATVHVLLRLLDCIFIVGAYKVLRTAKLTLGIN
jgi:hypothetical protein